MCDNIHIYHGCSLVNMHITKLGEQSFFHPSCLCINVPSQRKGYTKYSDFLSYSVISSIREMKHLKKSRVMHHEKNSSRFYFMGTSKKCIRPPTSNEESSQPWLFPQAHLHLASGQPSNDAGPQLILLAEMTSW